MGKFNPRLSCLLALLASIALPVHAGQTSPSGKETPQDLINALHSAFGDNHSRAVHAKGIVVLGTFTATKEARTLSASPIFSGVKIPVTARFSDFTGIPTIPDTALEANPRGFALKFHTKKGAVDVVAHSFNGFPVATTDEFAVFLRDIGSSGAGVAHPTPIEQFLESHPIAKAFVTSQKPPPASFATLPFFGVNSFKFINASGAETYIRYRFVPLAGEAYLSGDDLKIKGPNYLQDELTARIAGEAIGFDWFAQVAGNSDKIDNPSIAWPEDRRLVKLGTITIEKLADDESVADKTTLFLPGEKHSGILPADPMLELRNKAYPLSFEARQ